MKSIIYLLLVLASVNLYAADLKLFTWDGCSLFPDGDFKNTGKWVACCLRHDFVYWKGGTKSDRESADQKLKQCVADLGEEDIAKVMHLGVTLGGSPIYPTWYRWGYGWPYSRGYKPLTEAEQKQVRETLMTLRDLLDDFIAETK